MVNIDELIRVKFDFVKAKVAEGMRTKEKQMGGAKMGTHYGTLSIVFVFYPESMELRFIVINEEGKKTIQTIRVTEAESNLMNGSKVYYFVCMGYRCRTMYTEGERLYPRASFKHIYDRQKMSRLQRDLSPLREPYKKYGKMYYLDRITPYGRRVERFKRHEDKGLSALVSHLRL